MKGCLLVGVVDLPSAVDESKVPARQVAARQPEPCSAAQGLILVFSPLSCQVPFKRRDCGEDLLPAGADQDQAHGDRHHQEGDDGHGAQRVPRERHHSEVRDHGRGTCER